MPAGDADALIAWRPGAGWEAVLPTGDPRCAFIDLYLPICSATAARPVTVGHLGVSLDGFIATHAGESRWVTGEQNMLHMHRLRALCDAVVVGAGTIAADDPQLTTRLVPGPNPLRVVLDPGRRLGTDHRIFADDAAKTLYVCARSLTRAGERCIGRATIVGVEERGDGIDAAEAMRLLRARGRTRVFVEGGGVTVSMFLEEKLLERRRGHVRLVQGHPQPLDPVSRRSKIVLPDRRHHPIEHHAREKLGRRVASLERRVLIQVSEVHLGEDGVQHFRRAADADHDAVDVEPGLRNSTSTTRVAPCSRCAGPNTSPL